MRLQIQKETSDYFTRLCVVLWLEPSIGIFNNSFGFLISIQMVKNEQDQENTPGRNGTRNLFTSAV